MSLRDAIYHKVLIYAQDFKIFTAEETSFYALLLVQTIQCRIITIKNYFICLRVKAFKVSHLMQFN